jgi:hypothetical protein
MSESPASSCAGVGPDAVILSSSMSSASSPTVPGTNVLAPPSPSTPLNMALAASRSAAFTFLKSSTCRVSGFKLI